MAGTDQTEPQQKQTLEIWKKILKTFFLLSLKPPERKTLGAAAACLSIVQNFQSLSSEKKNLTKILIYSDFREREI